MSAFLLPLAVPGGYELWIVLIILLILFGSRIPKVARSLGQGISEFKKGLNEATSQDEQKEEERRELPKGEKSEKSEKSAEPEKPAQVEQAQKPHQD